MDMETPKDYEKRSSGFSVRLGTFMGEKMDVSKIRFSFSTYLNIILIFSNRRSTMNGRRNSLQLTSTIWYITQQEFWPQHTSSKSSRNWRLHRSEIWELNRMHFKSNVLTNYNHSQLTLSNKIYFFWRIMLLCWKSCSEISSPANASLLGLIHHVSGRKSRLQEKR